MKRIKYINRSTGKIEEEKIPAVGLIKFLYNNPVGKASLNSLFKRKFISSLMGKRMNGKKSIKKINKFIKKNKINLLDYIIPEEGFKSFNEFFYRHIKPKLRPIKKGVVSPADGRVLAFSSIDDVRGFFIKGVRFNLKDFLCDPKLAKKYKKGSMFIVRLAPADYHRFHFPVDGIVNETKKIKGDYFSVSPLALKKSLKIFLQNKRTLNTINTEEYGEVLMSEIGATLTGSIYQSFKPNTFVKKGTEKGYFAFGGSTVVLLFKENTIEFSPDLIKNTEEGYETLLKMGETIAE